MLQPGEDGEIPFYKAIKCAMTVQMNKIISSDSDLVGIMLYGTVSSLKPLLNVQHCLQQEGSGCVNLLSILNSTTLSYIRIFFARKNQRT